MPREPDQEGSGRQLTRTSVYEVRVLRSERGPWSENEHGNQTFPSPAPRLKLVMFESGILSSSSKTRC